MPLAVLMAALGMSSEPVMAQRTPQTEPAEVEVQVYKKWIGASDDEADVEAHLICAGGPAYEPLRVNRDRPGSWRLEDIPDDGTVCTVQEVEQDGFVADIEDCRDLLVLPDQGAECTLVNTKVVKRIDMLNRYGLILMVAVMLGAGLAATHRYSRPT